MVRKRIKFISEESNHYSTLQEAMDDFIKFKTAQGMAELTMNDYSRIFKEFRRVSINSTSMDTLKQELLTFLTPLSSGSPAKFNRPYSNMNTLSTGLSSRM